MIPDDKIRMGYVGRPEYEQFTRSYETRQAELRLELKEIEVANKQSIQEVLHKIDSLATDLAKLNVDVSKQGMDIWKVVTTGLFSGIVGYVLATLQHIFLH